MEWYCRPDLLEEIEGDAYELYYRTAKQNKRKADILFAWNVLRFFRWRNIKSYSKKNNHLSKAMLKNTLTVSFRNAGRNPVQFLINVLGLSTGLSCVLLIFLWVTHEFSFDRFHDESEQIYKVLTHSKADGNTQTYGVASVSIDVTSIPEVKSMLSVSTGSRWPHELCFRPEDKKNECVYLTGVYASDNFFEVFNYPILKGDPHPLKGSNAIAISEKMAAILFGIQNPVGKTIKVDDHIAVTVASVFKNPPLNSSSQFDFAMTYNVVRNLWGIDEENFKQNFFEIYLKTDTPIPATILTEKLNHTSVLTEALKNHGLSYEAYPLVDWHLKSKFENGKNTGGRIEYVTLFIIIAVLVVAMAIINFVNMATARATLRAKEIGVRKVTGAARGSLIVQFLIESSIVVFIAFIVSAFVTQLALPYFNHLLDAPISIWLFTESSALYLAGFFIVITFLAGVYPALVMSGFQPISVLKSRVTDGRTGSARFRRSLLVVQLSVSIGVVIFCGILLQQLKFIRNKDLGIKHNNVVHLEPTYNMMKNFDTFKEELLKHPSIVNASTANQNPINVEQSNTDVEWQGKAPDVRIAFKAIGCSYDFPELLNLKLIQGRNFESLSRDTVRTEALLTLDAVKTMGLTDPIGEEIRIGDLICVVIGIISDFHTESLHQARLPVILFRSPYTQNSGIYISYQPGQTKEAMEAIQKVHSTFAPDRTMRYDFQDENYKKLYATEALAARLTMLLTVVALVIATIGVVGLATFNTLRKSKEISIRRVFGASVYEALALLFNQFTPVLLMAWLAACGIAWYASNYWLKGFAYRIDMPWWIFGSGLVGSGILIGLLIAMLGIKTIRTNPTEVLRSE